MQQSSLHKSIVIGLMGILLINTPAYAGGHREEKKKGGGETYIQFPALTLFTVIGRGRHGTLSVELGLDIPDDKLRAEVAKQTPRLRDAYLSRLQSYALSLSPNALLDTEHVSRELQTATDQTLKKPGAKVLLGSVMMN